jgi:hypothetical protein
MLRQIYTNKKGYATLNILNYLHKVSQNSYAQVKNKINR